MLGIVSDDEFEKELINCDVVHQDMIRGRGQVKEVPEVIREIISEEAINKNGSIQDIADKFGVSPSSVSAYKAGATSTASYNEPNEKLQKKNDIVRTQIISTARSKLLAALSSITPEKIAEAKLRDIASVAKDMSAVIHNTEPQVSGTNIGAQFVFHVPKAKHESDYEVIEVTQ